MRNEIEARINLSELLNVGNWIKLFALEQDKKLTCKITKFIGYNKSIIECNDFSKAELPLEVCIHHTTTTGLYKIEGLIKFAEDDEQILLVANEVGVEIREREFIRLEMQKEAKMAVLNHPAHSANEFPITIENISAGGAKLRAEKEILTGFFVEVIFSDLKGFPFNKVTAEVLWDKSIKKEQNKIYEFGVRFICSERERTKMADYVQQKQLEFIEKGEI